METAETFLQTDLWASFKCCFGWKDFVYEFKGEKIHVLIRRFGKIFSLAYIPYALEKKWENDIETLMKELKRVLPQGCVFIRYDLPWFVEKEGNLDGPCRSFLKKAPLDIQPPSSVILDLTQSEEEILKGMKERARRNIKTATKKGVVVTSHTVKDLNIWYELYKETSRRDKIAIHPYSYYEKLFLLAGKSGEVEVRLYLASVDEDVIAGIITLFNGPEAVYLYGASCNRKRETMPAYALQWQGIRDAKKYGCRSYDFYGCPPEENPKHPMHGLFLFKTGFSPNLIHRPGSWDYPCRPFIYSLYRIAESARKFWYKKLKKRHS